MTVCLGVKFTQEDFEKVETKKLANVIRRLNEGKTLTAREDALLASARAGIQTPGVGNYAHTWDELAKALGTTRRAMQDWRKDPRYRDDCPLDRADGRHEIAAWLQFMVRHGLKRADERVESEDFEDEEAKALGLIQPPKIGGSQADWNKAATHVEYEKKKDALEVFRGTLLVAAELEVPLGATFAALQTKLSQFPARVARFVKGLRDENEVEERLREEIDADLRDLQAAHFVETAVPELLQDFPFDAEGERLIGLVSFSGQDRAALLELVAHVGTEALRRIGRAAIGVAQKDQFTPDTAIADGKTGQVTDEAAAREGMRRAAPVADNPSIDDPPAASTGAASSTAKAKAQKSRISSKKKRRQRPQPATPPPEIEAAIVPIVQRKFKKRH